MAETCPAGTRAAGCRRRVRALCVVLPLLLSQPVAAAPIEDGPSSGRIEAGALSRLFAGSCFRHAGDPRGLRDALVAPSFRPASDAATARLLARPGRAYHVDDQPGHLVVLSFDDGWCGDGGTGIDPHALTVRLAATMQARGASMRLMGAENDGQEQHYLLTRPAPASPIVLLVLLQPVPSQPSGTLMQASLFAAPLPPPGAAPDPAPDAP